LAARPLRASGGHRIPFPLTEIARRPGLFAPPAVISIPSPVTDIARRPGLFAPPALIGFPSR